MLTDIGVRIRRGFVCIAILLLMRVHRIAMWIDGFLFPSLKEVVVDRPLFVVGLPRSGTTLCHRMMASHNEFTTFPLWELIFAPALCEKYMFHFLGKIDSKVGSPCVRIIRWIEDGLTSEIQNVHPTTLSSPEEDYLGLMVDGHCFLRVLCQPHAKHVWDLVYFGDRIDSAKRKHICKRYRGLLVRHLAFRGRDKRILSKNPSFTSWIPDLLEEFPDARIVGLRRRITQSLPSQLSSLRDGFAFFGNDVTAPDVVQRFRELFVSYWHQLDRANENLPANQFVIVEYPQLVSDPATAVSSAMRRLGYEFGEQQLETWRHLNDQSKRYVSSHRYQASDFGLTTEELEAEQSRFPSPQGSEQESPCVLS